MRDEKGDSEKSRVFIRGEIDMSLAIVEINRVAAKAGYKETQKHAIATVVSELVRNILKFAGEGEVSFQLVKEGGRQGLKVIAMDQGPGIEDIELAMSENHSTAGTLGLGLPGVRRLMDEFSIDSQPGKGTCVSATKWL
ncbi:anti-sigma regulatory factor [bacterium AH-315-F18]|nr:anti-sigma regulatory factor [bacterium AH-315-F18]